MAAGRYLSLQKHWTSSTVAWERVRGAHMNLRNGHAFSISWTRSSRDGNLILSKERKKIKLIY